MLMNIYFRQNFGELFQEFFHIHCIISFIKKSLL